jgi:hypothetical protein
LTFEHQERERIKRLTLLDDLPGDEGRDGDGLPEGKEEDALDAKEFGRRSERLDAVKREREGWLVSYQTRGRKTREEKNRLGVDRDPEHGEAAVHWRRKMKGLVPIAPRAKGR